MDEDTNEKRDDIKLPPGELGEQIKAKFEADESVRVTVLKAMGEVGKLFAKGDLIVCANGTGWLTTAGQDRIDYALDVTSQVRPEGTNIFEIWFTSSVFPFQQRVRRIELESL